MNVSVTLALGPLDRSHIEKAREWRNNHAVWRFCRQDDLIADADQEDWYERQRKDPTIRMYTVRLRTGSNEEIVGVCGFTSISFLHRRAEFSLYIDPAKHGQGLGTGALKTLLMHGFTNLGFNVIWGEAFDQNPAIKMFAKLGFKHEGTRRQHYYKDGRFIDAHLISLTREEWTSLTSASSQPSPPTTPDCSTSSGPSEEELKETPEGRERRLGLLSPLPASPQSAESPSS